MLVVNNVSKKYGSFYALKDINLEFNNGVYALLAPNGAGKTTLIKLLTTLIFPTSGEILYKGTDIVSLDGEYRDIIGYLPQDFGYYRNYTPRKFLLYLAALKGIKKEDAVEKVKEVLEYTDLVLLDIKAIDEKVYKELTGVELENTLKFAQYLKEKGKRVWIRHVIVPGITDNDELLNRLAEYVSNLDNVEKVELLPYHKLGEFKYKELGMKYVLEGVEELSKERLENAVSIFQKYNLKVN